MNGRPPARLVAACWIVALAVLFAGCASNVRFAKSDDFQIVTPTASDAVRDLPVRVAWDARGDAADAKHYAVFVDRSPIAPGKKISSLLTKECRRSAACSATYLEAARVYVTSERAMVLESLTRRQLSGRNSGRELHTVTVVALDENLARVGESYAARSFTLIRKDR